MVTLLATVVQGHHLDRFESKWVRVILRVNLPIAVHRQLLLGLDVEWLSLVNGAVERLRARFETDVGVGVTIEIQLSAGLGRPWGFRRY